MPKGHDFSTNTLTFALIAPPDGMTIDVATGVLNWTPGEAQGPSTNTITVSVTDDGQPNMSDTKSFAVVVNEVYEPPVLVIIGDQTVQVNSALNFLITATDPDLPKNKLTFRVGNNAPTGAVLTSTGASSWTPTQTGEFEMTVYVADNGIPSREVSETFKVTVTESNAQFRLGLPKLNAGKLEFTLDQGTQGCTYALEAIDDLGQGTWQTID